MTKGFCLVIVYAWVEFGYLRQTEQFDDDEGIVDKLAMSTQSCILDQAELIVKWWNTITMWVDKVGKEEVQLTHGYIDVVRVDAQVGMQTIGRLLQPFTIGRF